jgi:hypothetical protein
MSRSFQDEITAMVVPRGPLLALDRDAMSDVSRSIKEGAGFGLIAGVVFAIAQVFATMLAGDPAIVAFRRLASVLLGATALQATPTATAVVIGLIAHLYLSVMFGLFYGIYNSALTMPTRRSLPRQAVIGPLYGVMLWLVNFHVFARYRYPWLLELPQAPQVFLHAIFYGLPLGLLYARAERRVVPVQRPYSYQ